MRAAKKLLHGHLDLPVVIAGVLRSTGQNSLADRFLWRVHCANPYDLALAEHHATTSYLAHEKEYPVGTAERGHFLKRLLWVYPAAAIVEAYFVNASSVVKKEIGCAGSIVLGLGAGRCGSTTLAAIFHHMAQDAISTHENAPWVWWHPTQQQIAFHVDRFHLLSRYLSLVADCSHWWLNLLEEMFEKLPQCKAVGLFRDTDACVQSWMQVSPSDTNHFAPPHNRIWPLDIWDPLYPHYPVPEAAHRNPLIAKEWGVRRYVSEYNGYLHLLAGRYPERILLLRTEELDLRQSREAISRFIGLPAWYAPIHRNVGVDDDSPTNDSQSL